MPRNKLTYVERKLIAHLFIQWLATNNILNDWMDEMNIEHEDAGFYTDQRADRVLTSYQQNQMITISFGHTRSVKGPEFWNGWALSWVQDYRAIERYILEMRDEPRS